MLPEGELKYLTPLKYEKESSPNIERPFPADDKELESGSLIHST
jgi:hypothetical protein